MTDSVSFGQIGRSIDQNALPLENHRINTLHYERKVIFTAKLNGYWFKRGKSGF